MAGPCTVLIASPPCNVCTARQIAVMAWKEILALMLLYARISDPYSGRSWNQGTVCSISSYPFYIVTYYIKQFTASWTYSREVKNGHTVGDKRSERKKGGKQKKNRKGVKSPYFGRVKLIIGILHAYSPCILLSSLITDRTLLPEHP